MRSLRSFLLVSALVVALPMCGGENGGDATTAAGSDGGGDATGAGDPDGGAASDAAPVCSPGDVGEGGDPGTGQRVEVHATTKRDGALPVLLGANVNKWYGHAQGLWDPTTHAPNTDAVAKAKRAHLGLLRHPGGTAANLFNWKRAVGPMAQRGCQIDGEDGSGHADRDYGPSEFVRLLQAVGAEGEMMVPFVRTSPADAADWVEYMNAPVGTNPNGGTAWADVRAADGSPQPYGITRWEIGNEQDRGGHQAYWMATATGPGAAAATRQRLAQYIDGDDFPVTDEPLARDCDLGTTTTSNAADQTFYFQYGLLKPGTLPTVKVGGATWTRVDDLASSGPTDAVYVYDGERASVRFGDGTHGAVPPPGQPVTASYQFHHAGFVAIYDKMKATAAAIGVPIDVCAIWAPPTALGAPAADLGAPSFAAAMKTRGLSDRYDCVSMHPYVSFDRDFGTVWGSAAEAHDQMMLGDAWARTMLKGLVDDLAANAAPGSDGKAPYAAVSEFGALWFGGSSTGAESAANVPTANYGMSHALYMASQWVGFARLELGWAEGNTLVAEPGGLRGTLGGAATGFVYGAEAMTRELVGDVFAAGASWVGSDVTGAETVDAVGASSATYPALTVGATLGADGALRILVVNRRRSGASVAAVVPDGFAHGADVDVATVRGASFDSAVDGPSGPGDDTVALTRTTAKVDTASFSFSFPAASVTVLTLRAPCP